MQHQISQNPQTKGREGRGWSKSGPFWLRTSLVPISSRSWIPRRPFRDICSIQRLRGPFWYEFCLTTKIPNDRAVAFRVTSASVEPFRGGLDIPRSPRGTVSWLGLTGFGRQPQLCTGARRTCYGYNGGTSHFFLRRARKLSGEILREEVN